MSLCFSLTFSSKAHNQVRAAHEGRKAMFPYIRLPSVVRPLSVRFRNRDGCFADECFLTSIGYASVVSTLVRQFLISQWLLCY